MCEQENEAQLQLSFMHAPMSESELPREGTGVVEEECIAVYLRIRPFNKDELLRQEDQGCVDYCGTQELVIRPPRSSQLGKTATRQGDSAQCLEFTFTRVFKESTDQRSFYQHTTQPLVRDFLAGHNCLLFSYGVTNSGKTYTIQGADDNAGVLPRSLEAVFAATAGRQFAEVSFKPRMYDGVAPLDAAQQMHEQRLKTELLSVAVDNPYQQSISPDLPTLTRRSALWGSTSNVSDWYPESSVEEVCTMEMSGAGSTDPADCQYLLWVSFAEVYNENVFDLLDPIPTLKSRKRNALKLCEDKRGNIYVKGLSEICVSSVVEACKLLTVGQQNLKFASTRLNYNSSRSHCIYTLRLMKIVPFAGSSQYRVLRMSKLSFCDLAGSERSSKTHALHVRETGNINTSLMTLGRCITTLRFNQSHKDQSQIIPFRDSKLTRILQNFLIGKGKARMVVNINQLASSFDETLCVLKFSAIAKQVRFQAKPERVLSPFEPESFATATAESPEPVISTRDTMDWEQLPTPGPGTQPETPDTVKKAKPFNKTEEEIPESPIEEVVMVEEESLTEETEKVADGANGEADEENETYDEQSEVARLWEYIGTLREALLAEKKKNFTLEKELREELCDAFGEKMRDMRSRYSIARREEREGLEQLADDRMEMLIASVRKRQRVDRSQSPDTEKVEQGAGGQELAERIASLETQVEALRADLQASREAAAVSLVPENQPSLAQTIEQLQEQLAQAHSAPNQAVRSRSPLRKKSPLPTVDSKCVQTAAAQSSPSIYTIEEGAESEKASQDTPTKASSRWNSTELESHANNAANSMVRPKLNLSPVRSTLKIRVNDYTVLEEDPVKMPQKVEAAAAGNIPNDQPGTSAAALIENQNTTPAGLRVKKTRRRFSKLVKLNTAYNLRKGSSPSIKHNHETGSTYFRGQDLARRNMGGNSAHAGPRMIGKGEKVKVVASKRKRGSIGHKSLTPRSKPV